MTTVLWPGNLLFKKFFSNLCVMAKKKEMQEVFEAESSCGWEK